MNIEVVEERNNDVLVLLPVGRLDSTNARAFEIHRHRSHQQRRTALDRRFQPSELHQ